MRFHSPGKVNVYAETLTTDMFFDMIPKVYETKPEGMLVCGNCYSIACLTV